MRLQSQVLWINIIGGILVLGGYIYALIQHPNTRSDLWGGVPEEWRMWIVSSMFFAAFGYCYAMKYMIINDGLSLGFFWGKFDAGKIIVPLFSFVVDSYYVLIY